MRSHRGQYGREQFFETLPKIPADSTGFFVWENVEIGRLLLRAAANVANVLEAKP